MEVSPTLSAVDSIDPPLAEMPAAEADAEQDFAGQIRSGKLAGKSLIQAILVLAIPVLLQQTMQACVGLFDKIFAGALPSDIVKPAMDGLGIGSYIGWFIGIAMTGVGIGGQAIVARAIGGGNTEMGERALGQAITLSVVWGAFVGVVLWFIAPLVADICKLSPAAAVDCVVYVRTLSISMPFCGLMMVGSMCMYGAGETTFPSYIALGVNIVNIIFSWMLSGADFTWLANPFSFDLHVLGIAAGTSISYAFGAGLTLWVLIRGVKDLQLRRRAVAMRRDMTWRIVRIGVPNFMEGISMWAVNLFVLIFIGMIGAMTGDAEGLQGAHVIAVQWEAFSFMPGFAIGTAAGALAGQYLGAGNPRMAAKAVVVCTACAVVLMGALGIVFMTTGRFLTSIVSPEAVHLTNTPQLLFICGTVQVFFAITMVIRQGLRGVGDTKWTFIITTASSYGVRLPAAYLLGVHFELGLPGIWIALCGEFLVRAALFTARFLHGGWKNVKV